MADYSRPEPKTEGVAASDGRRYASFRAREDHPVIVARETMTAERPNRIVTRDLVEQLQRQLGGVRDAVEHLGSLLEPVLMPAEPSPNTIGKEDASMPTSPLNEDLVSLSRRLNGLHNMVDGLIARTVLANS